MVGLKFILTGVKFLLFVAGSALAVTAVFMGFSYMFRWMWDMFERTYEDQAKWILSKFHPLRAYKAFLIPFVMVAMSLCIGGFLLWIFASGNSAQGTPIP